MKTKFIFLIGAIILLVVLFVIFSGPKVQGQEIQMYKSASCSCCVGHSNYLEGKGYDVDLKISENLDSIKLNNNIPQQMQSCHTSFIDNYFIEGHMPLEAINKLLEEKPDIDGIALPGMPSGSPGMPGVKDKEWIIYSLKDGVSSEFMRI